MKAGGLALVALALASPAAASAPGGIAIDHAPLECVLYDRYARVVAAAPADAVAGAQLQFRARGDGDWYSIGMAAEGAQWSAYLPRPVRPLARLEYRIVMRSPDARESSTPATAARVGDEGECASPGPSSAALTAPIVVRVPEGAPSVPPVPAGFSPAGVMPVEDPRPPTSGFEKAALGTAVAGGITAAALLGSAAKSEERPEFPPIPDFQFAGTAPVPGGALSWRDPLLVFLLLTGRPDTPVDFLWSFEMLGVGREATCVSMSGGVVLFAALPVTVTLGGPLFPRVAVCGEQFDVDRARLRVIIRGQTVYNEVLAPLPFHFEP